MNTARAETLAARAQLLEQGGWEFRRLEAFRFVPPPAAAVWLGDEPCGSCDASPLAGAGWTLHPVGAAGLVDARWLDASDSTQRAALFAGLPLPGDDAVAPFAWAHRALCRQGLRLRVAAAADAEAPPLMLQLRHLPRETVEAPLLVVELEPGARCVIVETHERDAVGCSRDLVQNLQIHLRLGQGARLQHWRQVEPAAGDRIAHHLDLRLGAGAHYAQAMLAVGSAYHLQRTQVQFDGEDATAQLGSVLLADAQQLDQQVRMIHGASRSASTARALALARGKALVASDQYAHVRPGVENADIHQHLAGIPTGGAPRLVMRPQLEIENDAVQAAHGTTWGRLPEESIFFARQRGLDEATALSLILHGMAAAELERGLGDEALCETVGARQALEAALTRLLSAAPAAAPATEASHG
ncbi:MAG: SufD family Fe-S cluster assembly protein [Burkholderiales bacterium]|nr:SufD family Fe-S cluster assembly protein [Burkholderiales bacterium]